MSPALWMFVLSPFVGLLACVASHVLISRLAPHMPRVRSILTSVGIGLGVVAAFGLAFVTSPASQGATAKGGGTIVVWALAYICLVYCYLLGFYVLGETARRIRLIVELHGAGERGLTLDEILGAYNAHMILEARIGRLLAGGQIVEKNGRLTTGNSLMLYAAKSMVFLKLLFLGVRSESERI